LPFTGAKRIIFFLLELTCLKITTKLLAISYSEANRAVNELGFDRNKVEVILNAIPINEKPVDHVENGNLKIRMIGRLTRQKNILQFIEVANKLLNKYPTLQFSILGAGIHDDLADEIYKFLDVNNLTDKIAIEPWGNESTSQKFLQETDIFVMTSIFEGLAFSLLEAMSLAIPCVVSKVDGNTDVINNNENGFACIDSDDFYAKIELLVNDGELRKRIGKNGQNYVSQNHSVAINIHKIESLYKQLLDSDELVSNKIQMVSSY